MPDTTNKAVFLSYASQDAEAARWICEALRAAGVEVWFDQSELRGGDAWDAKIRKQIKECALFVPVISANTNARAEGYFRLEWKLAADRSHLIARDHPFLLPIIVDETPNDAARVPEEFHAVQWTRLNGGAVSLDFCTRVHALLVGGLGPGHGLSPVDSSHAAAPRPAARQRQRRWLLPALALGVVVAAAVWRPWHKPAPVQPAPTTLHPWKELTETQRLLAQAWDLLYKPEFARPQLDAAETLCKQAAALSPTDAEVWATWTYIDTWMLFFRLDLRPERRSAADEHAARAMQLNPRSFDVRVTRAFYWIYSRTGTSEQKEEARRMLGELLAERPDDPKALFALGVAKNGNDFPELERLAQNPRFAALALNEIAWRVYSRGEFARAEEMIDRSIAAYPYWHNLSLKMLLAANWHGDLAAAKAAFDRVPVERSHQDWMLVLGSLLHSRRRDPQAVLAAAQAFPRDWIASHAEYCPKAFLVARARQAAGQPDAAKREAKRAIALLDQALSETPNDQNLLAQKAFMLDLAGERPEAENTYRLMRQLGRVATTTNWAHRSQYELRLRFETADAVLADMEKARQQKIDFGTLSLTAASLRQNPVFDGLRDNPRFQTLLAEAEADPRWSPRASPAPVSTKTP